MSLKSNNRSHRPLLSRIKDKITIWWCYFYSRLHKGRFVSKKISFYFLVENNQKQLFSNANLQDKNNILNTPSCLDINYRRKISFYHYESSLIESTFNMVNFFLGSPLEESLTFDDIIYMPQYRSFYLTDGSLIDYSCRPEYTIAPKNITPPKQLTKIEAPLIYGGHLHRHYGHFLTECICRLWYLGKDDSRQVIFSETPRFSTKRDFVDIFLNSIFDRKRFIAFSQPILLKKVTIPHASFIFNRKAFSIHKLLLESVAEKLLLPGIKKIDQPLYLSRKNLTRGNAFRLTKNEDILEEKLIEKKFAIAYPEQLSIQEQIQLINRHKVIVGVCGSALHNILFDLSDNPNLVCLADEDFIDPNFLLVDGIKGSNSAYIAALKPDENSGSNRLRQTRIINLENTLSALEKLGLF